MQPDQIFYILGSLLVLIFTSFFIIVSITIIKTLKLFRDFMTKIESGIDSLSTAKEDFVQSVISTLIKFIESFEERYLTKRSKNKYKSLKVSDGKD